MEMEILSLLQKMNEKFDSFERRLDSIERRLDSVENKLEIQEETLKEHSKILGALITGQEFLKAEISELRLQNAKDFEEIKSTLKNHEDSIEILEEEVWRNKKSTLRIKKQSGSLRLIVGQVLT